MDRVLLNFLSSLNFSFQFWNFKLLHVNFMFLDFLLSYYPCIIFSIIFVIFKLGPIALCWSRPLRVLCLLNCNWTLYSLHDLAIFILARWDIFTLFVILETDYFTSFLFVLSSPKLYFLGQVFKILVSSVFHISDPAPSDCPISYL